ncbi:U-Kazal-Dg21.2-like [Episyrphus balteatus]|uniref:U-Kazal-Dg21.2-like n=1 Tax=Episyrphus balteatus TaxID=286459 RepID=UPI0024857724|nr:U-Kazal-Dg21.2-like [Episyrphus balteatus]
MNSIGILVLILILIVTLAESHYPKPCSTIFQCDYQENPVWSSDYVSCKAFRNNCWFKLENCNRKNNKQIELRKTTREKCQSFCNKKCTKIFLPVCADYRHGKYMFSNECEMERQICESGQTYILKSRSRCDCEYRPEIITL